MFTCCNGLLCPVLCGFISVNSVWHQLKFMAIISVILNGHLVCLVQMARNTRSGHNKVPPPPPPPPPVPAELLATLVEGQQMLNEAMQTMAQQNRGVRHTHQGGEANQYSNFQGFLAHQASSFQEGLWTSGSRWMAQHSRAEVSLVEGDWGLKMEYAAQQLEGKAGVWWSHYRASLPTNAVVTWD